MQYLELSHKKHLFIVTPEELRPLLADVHHVVVDSGVPKSYVESDPDDFFSAYDALYQQLKCGETLTFQNDWKQVTCTTGITRHLENCIYRPTSQLSVPVFTEPCPRIDTFCFTFWKKQLTTSFSIAQFPENVCGLRLSFPSRVTYEAPNSKHRASIVCHTDLDDYETYEALLSRIRALTKPLKLEFDGKIHRTTVRVSSDAKQDLKNFHFITSNNIVVL